MRGFPDLASRERMKAKFYEGGALEDGFAGRGSLEFSSTRVRVGPGPERGLRVEQNLAHGLAVRRREGAKQRTAILVGENLIEPAPDDLLHFRREPIVRRRVDEITARIDEEPRAQIQIAKRTPVASARSIDGKTRPSRRAGTGSA